MIHDNARNNEHFQAVLIGGDGKVKVVRQAQTARPTPALMRTPVMPKQPTNKRHNNEQK